MHSIVYMLTCSSVFCLCPYTYVCVQMCAMFGSMIVVVLGNQLESASTVLNLLMYVSMYFVHDHVETGVF